ncbi:hypothetical protein HG536_0D05080 [Torulaspora globosa]|uniref:Large ribosomal subunit protein uL15/eL18 domain-containing protein n=1 Tax=Torulaspora globosa TaxID=48254 RepID=A0A7G3ZHK0_9SACH|nr:uncharacterized protein HG536_0D05080 [Torulaspora globosa]QLL32986.1 hypothetical protein HG536_0D05080 [Torulaspora globosa]
MLFRSLCHHGGMSFSRLPLYHVRAMSLLGGLKPSDGSKKGSKRLGRGPSSGKGKTSGRGQKGQKARGKVKSWFEGGQTPIYKLFPKIGFTNVHAKPLNELSLNRIQWFHDAGRLNLGAGEVLDMKKMKDTGLVTGTIKHGVKILANGKSHYNLPIRIEASKATADAIKTIEASGGEFTARYFNRLGLRAHLVPEWFLEKRGRIPLQARPTRRKEIEYYSDEAKRGYLIKENDEHLLRIQEAKRIGGVHTERKSARKNALLSQLEDLPNDVPSSWSIGSSIITLDQLQAEPQQK